MARRTEPHPWPRRRRRTLRRHHPIPLIVWLATAYLSGIWTPTAHAQQPAKPARTLHGRVLETGLDDYGIPGVSIRVEDTHLSTTTDEDGRFCVSGITGSLITLHLEAPDYKPVRLKVSREEMRKPLIISLVWEGEEHVSETRITRSRPTTTSTTRLTPRDISAAPRRNAEEVLRQVPGLTLVQHGSEGKGHQFFTRGFDAIHGADLELTLHGIPINEWSNIHAQGYLDLALIIPETIQEVVVTKGPFTLEQGAFGMAGSADYQLGVPTDDRGWRAAYTVGTTNRHRAFVGYAPPDGGGQQFVGMEATRDDGFGQNRALTRATLNGRARLLDPGEGGTLDLTGLGSYSEFDLPGTLRNKDVEAGLVDFYGTYDPQSMGSSARGLLALRYHMKGEKQDLSIQGYGGYRRLSLLENFTGFLLNPIDGDRRHQRQETWSFGLSGSYEHTWQPQLAMRTSLGVRGDAFSQQEESVGRQRERIAARRALDGVQLISHISTGLRWSPIKDVRVDAGARLDLIHVSVTDRLQGRARGEGTLPTLSPRLTAQWKPLEAWKFSLAYGRGFRPPEARAFSSFDPGRSGVGEEVITGKEPSMTVSDAMELGAHWRPISWFGASISGFATLIERESIFDHVSGTSLELNGTRRLGGELVLQADPTDWLNLSADLTLVDARFSASGNRVPFAPWLVSGLRAVATHESGFRGGLRVLTVAPRDLPHGATGATLVMTDATLGYHWRWLRLDLEVENLFNQRLREGEYHYASHWRPGEPASEIPALHTTAGPPFNARLTLGVVF